MRNILDYYGEVGVDLLDQAQPKKQKKSQGKDVVYKNILGKLQNIQNYSEKYPITLTINRRKKHIRDYDDIALHRYIHKRLIRNCRWNKLKYILFPEYDSNGKLHYHGVIWDSYQATVSVAIKFWRNNFGFVDKGWSKDIRYYWCGTEGCTQKDKSKAKHCWYHYITKDTKKSGLYSLTNY